MLSGSQRPWYCSASSESASSRCTTSRSECLGRRPWWVVIPRKDGGAHPNTASNPLWGSSLPQNHPALPLSWQATCVFKPVLISFAAVRAADDHQTIYDCQRLPTTNWCHGPLVLLPLGHPCVTKHWDGEKYGGSTSKCHSCSGKIGFLREKNKTMT